MKLLKHSQFVFDITMMLLRNGAVDLVYNYNEDLLLEDFYVAVSNIINDAEEEVDPGMEICLIDFSIPIYERFLKENKVI